MKGMVTPVRCDAREAQSELSQLKSFPDKIQNRSDRWTEDEVGQKVTQGIPTPTVGRISLREADDE